MERKDKMMQASSEAESRVLSEAVARVAALWSIGDDLLGEILGIPASRAAGLRAGTLHLSRPQPAFRAGQYLVQLFQELSLLIGDDLSVVAWLETRNDDLLGRPIDLIRTGNGVQFILKYLEELRL